MGAALVLISIIACSAERYARPSGPAPRYEAVPVSPWDSGAPSADDGQLLSTPPGAEAPPGLRAHDAGRALESAQPTGSDERVQEN